MGRILTIQEISQKQNYIFSSKKLRANAERSDEIAYVTGSEFFRESAQALYDERENLVYAGGGHTVLQFDSREQAVAFTKKVTEAADRFRTVLPPVLRAENDKSVSDPHDRLLEHELQMVDGGCARERGFAVGAEHDVVGQIDGEADDVLEHQNEEKTEEGAVERLVADNHEKGGG